MNTYILGIDTNLALSKELNQEYKIINFNYIPRHSAGMVDNIWLSSKLPREEVYKLLMEFLSIISFEHDCVILPIMFFTQAGSVERLGSGGVTNTRSVVATLRTDFLKYLDVKYPTKLLQLYRIARAANSIYLSILFYWHIMSYGNQNEKDASFELSRYITNIKPSLSDILRRIKQNPIFGEYDSLGEYVRAGIRHSIAHIERDRPNAKNLEIDSYEENMHLVDIKTVLWGAARNKINRNIT